MPVTLCVLLWAREGQVDALVAYEDSVLPLIEDHGGHVVFRGRSSEQAEGPTEVHVLVYPSQDALDAYMHDERRVAMTAQREQAIARIDVFLLDSV